MERDFSEMGNPKTLGNISLSWIRGGGKPLTVSLPYGISGLWELEPPGECGTELVWRAAEPPSLHIYFLNLMANVDRYECPVQGPTGASLSM